MTSGLHMPSGLRRTRERYTIIFLAWAALSVVAGAAIWWLGRGAVVQAAGMEFTIWGAINCVFAAMGLRQMAEARRRNDPAWDRSDAEKLLGGLKVSRILNWVWLAMGLALAVWAAVAGSPVLWGHAIGVFVQGAFLFVFDQWLERAVSRHLWQA